MHLDFLRVIHYSIDQMMQLYIKMRLQHYQRDILWTHIFVHLSVQYISH